MKKRGPLQLWLPGLVPAVPPPPPTALHAVDEPATLITERDGRPICFAWRGRRFDVTELQMQWEDTRPAWPAPVRRSRFRVVAGKQTFDLVNEPHRKAWTVTGLGVKQESPTYSVLTSPTKEKQR